MSDDNKNENVRKGGSRGEVGKATPSLTIKQRWQEDGGKLSLKQFARKLKQEGDQVAKDWFGNKAGRLNKKRSDANVAAAKAASAASKAARKSKK